MPRLLVIGGSDAGIAAAIRAREVAPSLAVTVVLADRFPNYSICGLPFYLSGEVPDWHDLAHRTVAEIEGQGIELLLDTRATAVDAATRRITVVDQWSATRELPYDRLVIATGATATHPPIAGLDLPGVFPLHTMEDSFHMNAFIKDHQPRSAIIVGAGYIGVEMADAMTHRGIQATLVQHGPSVLATVEPSIGAIIGDELRQHGVTVVTGVGIERIEQADRQLVVNGSTDRLITADASSSSRSPDSDNLDQLRTFHAAADLVLVAIGVQPETELARSAGVATGGRDTRGAIRVTRAMETNTADIYAAGECVETWHRLLQRPTYLPLGTTAHKQGRIAGENAALDLAEAKDKSSKLSLQARWALKW